MSITLYKATVYDHKIQVIEAEKVTDKCYFTKRTNGLLEKNLLLGESFGVFKDLEIAILWRTNVLKQRISAAKSSVAYWTNKLQEFESSLLK